MLFTELASSAMDGIEGVGGTPMLSDSEEQPVSQNGK